VVVVQEVRRLSTARLFLGVRLRDDAGRVVIHSCSAPQVVVAHEVVRDERTRALQPELVAELFQRRVLFEDFGHFFFHLKQRTKTWRFAIFCQSHTKQTFFCCTQANANNPNDGQVRTTYLRSAPGYEQKLKIFANVLNPRCPYRSAVICFAH